MPRSRAFTEDEIEEITEQWHCGIGPDGELHEALGWTWEEYQRYENAKSGVSGESSEAVLASFAPRNDPVQDGYFKLSEDVEGLPGYDAQYHAMMAGGHDRVMNLSWADMPNGAKITFLSGGTREKAMHFYSKALDFVEEHYDGKHIFIGNVHVTPERPCPPSWHVAPFAGRFIVRSTTTGIARIAPYPNDFATRDAAQRRADQLNETKEN